MINRPTSHFPFTSLISDLTFSGEWEGGSEGKEGNQGVKGNIG